jgi:hypothetical protein
MSSIIYIVSHLDTWLAKKENGSYERLIYREAKPGIWQWDIDEPELFYRAIAKLYERCSRIFFGPASYRSILLLQKANHKLTLVGT